MVLRDDGLWQGDFGRRREFVKMISFSASRVTRALLFMFFAGVCTVSAARAQQMQAGIPGNFPRGVTVVASGSSTAAHTVDIYNPMPLKGASLNGLMHTMKSMGITPTKIINKNGDLTITVASSKGRDFRLALKKAHWTAMNPDVMPVDPIATTTLALQDAMKNARLKASVLAAAADRHLGKILNIEPAPADYLSGMSPLVSLFAGGGQNYGPTITETEIVTFELLP